MKRTYDPTQGLQQFILGVYAYWQDKGVSKRSSQKRMIQSTYDALRSILMKQDNDEALFIEHANQFQLTLKAHGISITKEASSLDKPTASQIKQLTQLKQLEKAISDFTNEYPKGSE